MKKIILILLTMILLSGCTSSEFTLDIDDTGKVKLTSYINIDKSINEAIDIENIRLYFDDIKYIEKENSVDYIFAKTFNNKIDFNNIEIGENELVAVGKESYIANDIYNIKIKLEDLLLNNEKINIFNESKNITIHIKSPITFEASNANKVNHSENSTVYTWEYNNENFNDIYIQIKKDKSSSIIDVVLFTLIPMIVFTSSIYILMKHLNKSSIKKNKNVNKNINRKLDKYNKCNEEGDGYLDYKSSNYSIENEDTFIGEISEFINDVSANINDSNSSYNSDYSDSCSDCGGDD